MKVQSPVSLIQCYQNCFLNYLKLSFVYYLKKLEETDAKEGVPDDHDDWLKSTVYSKTFKKGDEPKIYNALLSKYKDKAVARKQRPKPKYDDDYLKDDFK